VRELGHAHVLERGEVDYRRFRPAGPFSFRPLGPVLPLVAFLSALPLLSLAVVPLGPVLLAGAAAFGAVAALGPFAPVAAFGAVTPVGALWLLGLGLGLGLRLRLGLGLLSLLGLLGPWGLLGPRGLLGPWGLPDPWGLLGGFGPFACGSASGRSSLTIRVHRSVIPSPVAADTGRTGAFSCLVHLSRARRRSARESLSIFVATTAAVSGSDAVPVSSFRAAWVVSVRIQSQAATSCGSPGWRASTSCSSAVGLVAPPK
jgi:hypothetical protein